MSNRRALDVIEIKNPCPAPWEAMSGDAKRRFCTHCNKFVHDLTQMSSDEAERLVCESAGELCVRFARDPQNNRILTLDYRPRPMPSRRRVLAVVLSIAGAICFSGTWAVCKVLRKPPPAPPPPLRQVGVTYLGGAIAPPPPATPPRASKK